MGLVTPSTFRKDEGYMGWIVALERLGMHSIGLSRLLWRVMPRTMVVIFRWGLDGLWDGGRKVWGVKGGGM